MQHIWGWVKVMGDLGILPYPGATGTTGTQICTRRLSHFFPSTLYSKEAPAEEEEAGEAPAMLSRRETRLFRIKVHSTRKVSGLGWLGSPKGAGKEHGESPFYRGQEITARRHSRKFSGRK